MVSGATTIPTGVAVAAPVPRLLPFATPPSFAVIPQWAVVLVPLITLCVASTAVMVLRVVVARLPLPLREVGPAPFKRVYATPLALRSSPVASLLVNLAD